MPKRKAASIEALKHKKTKKRVEMKPKNKKEIEEEEPIEYESEEEEVYRCKIYFS